MGSETRAAWESADGAGSDRPRTRVESSSRLVLSGPSYLARRSCPCRPQSPGRRAFGQCATQGRVAARAISWFLRSLDGNLLHAHEEAHLADHAPRGVVVGHLDRIADAVQAERPHGRTVPGDVADRALDLSDSEPTGHRLTPGRADRR